MSPKWSPLWVVGILAEHVKPSNSMGLNGWAEFREDQESDMAKIKVKGTEITVFTRNEADYICMTDIARYKNPDRTDDLIRNWLRNRNTIEFLGVWEQLNNPAFNPVEFDGFGVPPRRRPTA